MRMPVLTARVASAHRRACIQAWAADELLSHSLADMLGVNDRLHAELDRWEHLTQSLILSQSMPMVSALHKPPHLCYNQTSSYRRLPRKRLTRIIGAG